MPAQADGTVSISTKLDNKGLERSLGGMEHSLKKVFGLFSKLAIGAALVTLAKQSKEAYDTVVENETRLAHVMRTTMAATDDQIRSILDLASAQQELGIVEDDVQVAGAQELATYLGLTDSLKTLVPVMNDMIAQQYGFNATQEAGVNIATMMGKVMGGQTGALSRYGYEFTEAQAQILKFGNEQERAATLAAVVSESVGGMNFALAQTDVGRQRQLANAFGDIKENLGAAINQISVLFLPALSTLANFLATVANYARMAAQYIAMLFGKNLSFDDAGGGAGDTADAYDNLAGSAGGAADAQDDLAAATKGAGKAAKGALAAFDDLNVLQQDTGSGGSGGSGGGGGGGGGLAGGGAVGILEDIEMSPGFLAFMETLEGFLEPLKDISFDNLVKSFNNLLDALKPFGMVLFEGLKWFWDNIAVPFAAWVIEDALPATINLLAGAIRALTPIIEAFKNAGIWLWENFLGPIARWAGSTIVATLDGLSTVLEGIGDFFNRHSAALEEGAKILMSLVTAYGLIKGAMIVGGGVITGASALASGIGKIGSVILAHPALAIAVAVGGGIVYIATKISEANRKAKKAELDKRFGDITLSMEELQEIVDRIETPFTRAMDNVFAQSERARAAADNVKELNDALTSSLLEAKINVGLDNEAQSSLLADVEALISATQEQITQRKASVIIKTQAAFGDDAEGHGATLINAFNQYMLPLETEAAKVGEKLRAQTVAALEDENLSEEEYAAISATAKRLMEIMAEIESHEIQVKLQRTILDMGAITFDSAKELSAQIEEAAQAEIDRSRDLHLDLMAEAMVSFASDPAKRDAEIAALEEQWAQNDLEIELKYEEVRIANLAPLLTSYAENEFAKIDWDKIGDSLPNASTFLAEAVNATLNDPDMAGYLDDPIVLSEEIRRRMSEMYSDLLLDKNELDVAEQLLAAMDISPEAVQGIIDKYEEAGMAIPQGVLDGITDAGKLAALIEASKTTLGHINEGSVEIINEMARQLAEGGAGSIEDVARIIEENYPLIADALGYSLEQGMGGVDLSEGSTVSRKATEAAALIVDKAGKAVEAGAKDLEASGAKMLGNVAGETAMTAADGAGESLGDESVDGTVNALKDSNKTLQAAGADHIATPIHDGANAEESGATIGNEEVAGVTGAMAAQAETLTTAGATAEDNIGTGFNAAAAGYALGENWAKAVAAGSDGQEKYLLAAGKRAGGALKKGAETALDIHSPSRVGLEIGENFGEATGDGAVGAIERITRSILSAMDALVDKMQGALGRFDPPPLEIPIAAAAYAAPNIPMPAIARGAVVPPGMSTPRGQGGIDTEGLANLIRTIVREEAAAEGEPVINVHIHYEADTAAIGRFLRPIIKVEQRRVGGAMISGGEYD